MQLFLSLRQVTNSIFWSQHKEIGVSSEVSAIIKRDSWCRDKRGTLDLWVEYCLLIKVSHYYFNVGKYRFTDGTEEVDIVYTLEDIDFTNKCMIEVKNRPEKQTTFSKYVGVQMTGIQEFVISYSDQEFQEVQFQNDKFNRVFRMRNDVIVLLLELAFMEKSGVDYYKASLLSELYSKFFCE